MKVSGKNTFQTEVTVFFQLVALVLVLNLNENFQVRLNSLQISISKSMIHRRRLPSISDIMCTMCSVLCT